MFSLQFFFFLMIRRPPRSTLDRSSAASDVYKRQGQRRQIEALHEPDLLAAQADQHEGTLRVITQLIPVSYTHLRAHETVLDIVCRLLLEKKKKTEKKPYVFSITKLHSTRSARYDSTHDSK